MDSIGFIFGFSAAATAFLLSFLLTPAVRVLAFKINAVDIPKDARRMHAKPMPLIGGLAIFISFTVTSLIFSEYSGEMLTLWAGGAALILLGIFDDIYDLNAWLKFACQIVIAIFAISQGVVIKSIYIFGATIEFGWMSYPLTVLWIVGLVNAFNLIDGLDGLSCGVCSICSMSLIVIAVLMNDLTSALLASLLLGSCLGFLPFNFHPARIFMGDTGAYFLGFVLSILSIEGLFKMSAVISFVLPVIIFVLPLFDTVFAFIRRIINHQGPFSSDKSHLHHRLIAFGLSHKETVLVFYAISALFGLIAIIYTDALFSDTKLSKALILTAAAALVCIIDYILLKHEKTRRHLGIEKEENSKE